jgi:hypothetical protein
MQKGQAMCGAVYWAQIVPYYQVVCLCEEGMLALQQVTTLLVSAHLASTSIVRQPPDKC